MLASDFLPLIERLSSLKIAFQGVFPLNCVPKTLSETNYIIVNTEYEQQKNYITI